MTASKGIRSRRSDAGQVRLSERDAAVLRFLGEQFGCPLSVVADLYGVGDRVARRHVARLERAGFASRLTVAGQQWVVPTRAGLRFADLDHDVWQPRAWKLDHVEGWPGCASP
jgi:DNA-binding MarR family transcriptional regulator